jgi:hypothetical protein
MPEMRLVRVSGRQFASADRGALTVATRKHKPKLGSGKRFASLVEQLEKKGAKNPRALAAYIGRKKLGAKKMAKLAATGRKRKGIK